MKQHENDLTPGPLTVNGFKGGSCCQAILPDINRTPARLTSKGHRWFGKQSGCSLKARNKMMPENTSNEKLKTGMEMFPGYPDLLKLHTEKVMPRFCDCLVATEFRPQVSWTSICPEKTGTIALNANICNRKTCEGTERIKHSKTVKSSYNAGKCHSCLSGSNSADLKMCGKTLLQRQRKHLPILLFLSVKSRNIMMNLL
jgi:hypothetical protein